MRKLAGQFFLIYFFFWMADNCLSQFLGLYYAYRGFSGLEISSFSGAFNVAVVISALTVGVLSDRFQRPGIVLLLLCCGMCCGTAVILIGRAFAVMAAGVCLYGFANAPFNGITDKVLIEKLDKRAGTFGYIRTGGTVGAACGSILGGVLLQNHFSYPALFVVFWITMTLCAMMVLPVRRQETKIVAGSRFSAENYGKIIRDRRFFLIYLTLVLWGFTESGSLQFMGIHITASGYSAAAISLFVAVSMCGEAVMFFLYPWLAARLRQNNVIALAFWLQAIKMAGLALLQVLPFPVVLVAGFLGGGAYAIIYSCMTARIADTFTGSVSYTAQTLKIVAIRGIGMTAGLYMTGLFYEKGNIVAAYTVLAACAFAGTLYYLMYEKRMKGRA